MLPPVAAALVLAFPALVIVAALKDVLSFTIPNWISLALLAVFPLAAVAAGVPLATIGLHLGVGAMVLAAGLVMFALRWVGGGDAKLAAVVALWMGWPAVITFLFAAALVGGGLATVLILMRSAMLRPVVLLGPRWVTRLAEPGQGVPYGVALAAGALIALPASPWAAVLAL